MTKSRLYQLLEINTTYKYYVNSGQKHNNSSDHPRVDKKDII